MKKRILLLILVMAVILPGIAFAGTLFTISDCSVEAQDSFVIVYRTTDHVVAFGTVGGNSEQILDDPATDLRQYALVTVRNHNGILQTTELGDVVYTHGRTLIVRLRRPLTGDFLRSDVFQVQPLVETRAPATPLHVPVTREYDNAVADIVASVNEDSLISITTNLQSYLTRYSNTDGYDTACSWSNDRFNSYGLDSEIKHFTMQGYDCQNVVATQTGTVYPSKYWIICGHLDSTSPQPQTDAPGADDNGSGSAAVMEAARTMSQYDFEYTVLYILWGGEEEGLYGSAHFADSAAAAGSEILGVVNLDMIFYGPAPDDKAELHYNSASLELGLAFDAISDTYVPALQKTVASPPVSASDHSSFWNAGYAALLSIEKEVWNNPYYHQTTDVISNYTQYFPFGTNMARAAIATVAHLAVPVTQGIEEGSFHSLIPSVGLSLISNPVTTSASASVTLPVSGTATVSLFDITGRKVVRAASELPAGTSTIDLDVQSLSPGMYLIKLNACGTSASSRLVVTR